jgi:hypothetical protein
MTFNRSIKPGKRKRDATAASGKEKGRRLPVALLHSLLER